MANRPCNPDADAKRIWELVLPDTPFPACGTQEDAAAAECAAPANEARDDARPHSLAPSPSAVA
jgi:hypothetical protein